MNATSNESTVADLRKEVADLFGTTPRVLKSGRPAARKTVTKRKAARKAAKISRRRNRA